MAKRLTVLFALLLVVACLASCGGEQYEAPDGFYVASDPTRDGCYFVVPEGWTYTKTSGIMTANVSNLSSGNMTVVFLNPDAPSVSEWWAAHEGEFAIKCDPDSYKLNKVSETRVDKRIAYLYEYDCGYEGKSYRIHQYIVLLGESMADGVCVLTITASLEKNISGSNDFEDHYKTFQGMVDYFRFSESAPVAGGDLADTEAEAPDGMKLASDPRLLGMHFYVPTDWKVGLTGGYINASLPDGANVGVSAVDYQMAFEKMEFYGLELHDENGFSLYDYWNVIQAEYSAYFTDFTVIESPVTTEGITPVTTGESTYYRFIFSATVDGISYEMTLYVFRATSSFQNRFYTALYTATAEVAPLHRAEVEKMLEEVDY
jgi:hypothetical protein